MPTPAAIFLAFLSILGAASFLRTGLAAKDRTAPGWFVLAASGLFLFISVVTSQAPAAYPRFSSAVGWAAAVGAALGAFGIGVALRGRHLARDLLDASVTTVTLFFIAWAVVLHAFLQDRHVADTLALQAAVLPGAWVTFGLVMVLCARRSTWPTCVPYMLLGVALIAAGLIGLGLALARTAGLAPADDVARALWGVPLALAAATGFVPLRERVAALPGPARALEVATVLLVGVLVAIIIAVWHVLAHGHLDTLLFWMGTAALLLLALREWVAVADSAQLRRKAELAGAQANQLLAERQGVLRTLAHDVLGFMTPVKIQAYVLSKLAPGDVARREESLGILRRSADNLEAMLLELRDFARVSDKRLEVVPRPSDVAAVVRSAAEGFVPEAERLGVRLIHDGPRRLDAHVDAPRIAQVVNNLVRNAIKFTPTGGRIDVTVRAQGAQAVLEVRDTGRGLSPDEIPRLFKAFARAHAPDEAREQGTGLGLFISKGIVEAHGGRIWAKSAGRGAGSTFVVELPLGPPASASTSAE